jgi:hypothetical protein
LNELKKQGANPDSMVSTLDSLFKKLNLERDKVQGGDRGPSNRILDTNSSGMSVQRWGNFDPTSIINSYDSEFEKLFGK